jgi:hypothetical protein
MPAGEMPWHLGLDRPPGDARIVVNMWNSDSPEVMYHDPTQPPRPERRNHPFALASYRAREVVQGEHEGEGKTRKGGLGGCCEVGLDSTWVEKGTGMVGWCRLGRVVLFNN